MIVCKVCGDHAVTYLFIHGTKFHLCATHSKDKSWMKEVGLAAPTCSQCDASHDRASCPYQTIGA